jgi:hypothetical protein
MFSLVFLVLGAGCLGRDANSGVCWQVPCVAVESVVYGAVRAAFTILVVAISKLGYFPGGFTVDRVVGVQCVSRCRYVGQVGLVMKSFGLWQGLTLHQIRSPYCWSDSE